MKAGGATKKLNIEEKGFFPAGNRRLELLAPAGGFEAFKAAVENGADAVYLGGKSFGARASAANFSLEEIEQAVIYAHQRQVKVYVTVNTLVADKEFAELGDYIYELYSLGVDALIVQDIGVASFIKAVLPEMEIHASTQMTQNNSFGLKQLENIGFSRVVLARETSAAEVEQIAANTRLDIEVFVHGALCICYSGQCLMSSYIGARSGNRGRCAQPCRLNYHLVDKNGRDLLAGGQTGDHLLSPRDLNLVDNLAELKKTGVKSLKIEGRMKRPEYVATVTRIYRKALDSLELPGSPGLDDRDRRELAQIFNRDFTTGYLKGYQGSEMMSYTRPNNRGVRLGRIMDCKKGRLTLKLEDTLNMGDGLEIWTGRGREGVTVGKIYNSQQQAVESAESGQIVSIDFSGKARVGDRVFKTYDYLLMEKARLSYKEGGEKRKRPLKMRISGKIGTKLRLEATDGDRTVFAESVSEAEAANNRPLVYDYLFKQLGRLGTTPFFLAELEMKIKEDLIIPVKELNEMRRSAVDGLLKQLNPVRDLSRRDYLHRVQKWHNKLAEAEKQRKIKPSASKYLSVAISNPDLLAPVLKAGANRIILGGEHWRCHPVIKLKDIQEALHVCRSQKAELVWRLPRIMNEQQSKTAYALLQQMSAWPDRPTVLTANLAGIEMVKSLDPGWRWETDHYFYVFNRAALLWVLEQGAAKGALSTELSEEQLREFIHADNTEIIVFGDMEMMVSEYCVAGAVLSGVSSGNPRTKCGEVCRNGEYYLKDRMNYRFPLKTDRECRMHIFNAKRLNLIAELPKIADMGIKNIRLELHRASSIQAQKTVKIFHDQWLGDDSEKSLQPKKLEEVVGYLENIYPEGFTKGHFYRGVLM